MSLTSEAAPPMPEPPPNAELMRSLGRLVRGLSALFWGLPVALIVCFHTARAESLRTLGILPSLISTGWLVYGLWQLGDFQKQERIWQSALSRATVFSLVNFGLSPFLYWWNRVPGSLLFQTMVLLFCASSLLFLGSLNQVLQRLGAMLPDEALRTETRQFTALNLNLLLAMLLVTILYLVLSRMRDLPYWLHPLVFALERGGLFLLIPLLLLPLAMTMALLWKTKEVILDSVFGGRE
jgi:hypothetical protein